MSHPASSPRKGGLRGHKRNASDSDFGVDASQCSVATTAGRWSSRARSGSASPFTAGSNSASSSPQKSPSTSRRRQHQRRPSHQQHAQAIPEDDEGLIDDYDDEMDAEGEEDDEFVMQDLDMDVDADGEEDEDVRMLQAAAEDQDEIQQVNLQTPKRQFNRPKRLAASTAASPLVRGPTAQATVDEDADETPSLRSRKTISRKSRIESPDSASENEVVPPSRRPRPPTHSALPDAEPPTKQEKQPEEEELSAEAKQAAQAEREEEDMRARWMEEYFEIVEQLPLEVHRTLALMRELEGQMQNRFNSIIQNTVTYRDARLQLQKWINTNAASQNDQVVREPGPKERPADKVATAESEDEAENLLGGSQPDSPSKEASQPLASAAESGEQSAVLDHKQESAEEAATTDPSAPADSTAISDGVDSNVLLSNEARKDLLRQISHAADESVKAAEEKVGLAVTAYNWIDRHIRRLDADISKMESSILLGLRNGTEESRGVREALGLPVDEPNPALLGDGTEDSATAAAAVHPEAESAALAKAAGAANKATSDATAGAVRRSGRKSNTTTPKMGGETDLPSIAPETGKRSRSASSVGTEATRTSARMKKSPSVSALELAVPPSRGTRTKKPKPKSQKRSAATSSTATGVTTEGMAYDPNEPTYCYCDQVSFDDMVACDNDDCRLEWFHYSCVGLESPPKGKWYCRFCAPKDWKGQVGLQVPPNAKFKPPPLKKSGTKT